MDDELEKALNEGNVIQIDSGFSNQGSRDGDQVFNNISLLDTFDPINSPIGLDYKKTYQPWIYISLKKLFFNISNSYILSRPQQYQLEKLIHSLKYETKIDFLQNLQEIVDQIPESSKLLQKLSLQENKNVYHKNILESELWVIPIFLNIMFMLFPSITDENTPKWINIQEILRFHHASSIDRRFILKEWQTLSNQQNYIFLQKYLILNYIRMIFSLLDKIPRETNINVPDNLRSTIKKIMNSLKTSVENHNWKAALELKTQYGSSLFLPSQDRKNNTEKMSDDFCFFLSLHTIIKLFTFDFIANPNST